MIFHWTSGYLSSYCNGNVVVSANSIEEAREFAVAAFEEHVVKNNIWSKPVIELRERFKEDLAEEPNVNDDLGGYYIYNNVVFIDGCD